MEQSDLDKSKISCVYDHQGSRGSHSRNSAEPLFLRELLLKAEPNNLCIKNENEEVEPESEALLVKTKGISEVSHRVASSYKCNLCGRIYTNNWNLKRHTNEVHTHTGKKPLKCPICSGRFLLHDGSHQCHLKSHENEIRPFSCQFCKRTFKRRYNLFVHLKIHTGERSVTCPFCTKTFKLRHHLLGHLRSHTGERPYKCHQCSKSFMVSSTLKNHLKIHDNYKCKQSKTNPDSLNQFRIRTEEKSYKCHYCLKKFTTSFNLKRHLKIHNRPEDEIGQFNCQYCTKTFKLRHNFLDHLRNHLGEKPYKCHQCSKTFIRSSYLKKHLKIHNHPEDKISSFSCQFCTNKFKLRHHLFDHLRSHTGERPYKCHQCSKSFTDSTTLKNHLKIHDKYKRKQSKTNPDLLNQITIRTKEKSYKCHYCLKKFTTSLNLKRHLKIHNRPEDEIRRFNCQYCTKTFKLKHHLLGHLRNHTGEKPYKCHQCSKTFIRSSYLKKHLKIHNHHEDKISSFSCQFCPSKFKLRHHLFDHLRSHTGERPYKCHQCLKTFFRSSTLKYHLKIHNKLENAERLTPETSFHIHFNSHYQREKKLHKCNFCSKSFRVKWNLETHIRSHTGEKPYKCLYLSCHMCFSSCRKRSTHMRAHTKEGNFSSRCHTPNWNQVKFKDEMSEHEESSVKDFRRETIDSKRLTTTSKSFNCKACQYRFSSEKTLCLHYMKCHNLPQVNLQQFNFMK